MAPQPFAPTQRWTDGRGNVREIIALRPSNAPTTVTYTVIVGRRPPQSFGRVPGRATAAYTYDVKLRTFAQWAKALVPQATHPPRAGHG